MTYSTPPLSPTAFQERLTIISDDLPKRLRQCAEYLAHNTDRIAVSTVAEIAQGAGVQPSALMRFCQIMGFSGFSDMQRLFRENYQAGRPDYPTRLKNLRDKGAGSPSALLAEFVDAGHQSLESLANSVDPRVLDQTVKLMAQARTIHLIGLRRSYPVASYLAYAFEKMKIPALLHSIIGNLDQRQLILPGDVLVAITFAPYSAATVELAWEARHRGATVIAITDTVLSPLLQLSDLVLNVPEVDFGAFRALSATLSLAITLAVAVGAERREVSG